MESLHPEFEFYSIVLKLLSLVYLEPPSAEFMDSLCSNKPYDHWSLDSTGSNLKQGLNLLRSFCEAMTSETLEKTTFDYTRLFLGLEKTLAPPFESVFLSEEHLMFEKQTLAVRSFYERYSLQVPARNNIPDDHLGYELQFAALLCDRFVANSHEKGVRDALTFLDTHPLKWVDEWVSRVMKYGETDYYRAMALITQATLRDLRRDFNAFLKDGG